jgi:glycine cleavage system H protein
VDYPEELRYSTEHEWVRVEGGRATVGITAFAQDALGDVVYVQLPDVGALVTASASISEVESTKSVSEIFAPVSGEIVAVNDALQDTPELLNSDPYGGGWILSVEMSDPDELAGLMDAAGYRALVES